MDCEQELHLGIEAQKAGRMGDAVRHYGAVLAADPENVDALNLMSVVALTAQDPRTSADLASRATAAQPDWFVSWINLGNALQSLGKPDEAADAFRKAITLNPQSAEGFVNLASALNAAGHAEDAADMAVKAILIAPEMADAHINFGNALLALGSPGEAVEAFYKATRLAPGNELAWFNMGNAYAALDCHDAAADSFRRSIALADSATKQFNLGNALVAKATLYEAVAAFERALAQKPDYLDAWINLGAALRDAGRLDEAEAAVRKALEMAPDEPELHWNLALVLLTRGQYSEGWREYQWRWRTPHFSPFVRRFPSQEWQGEPLAGRTLLVHYEQGFGDAIQMCRLVPPLEDLGARVVVECRPGLGRLLTTLGAGIAVVEAGEAPLPATDLHVALMSLPLRLGLTVETIPARVPYLAVPEGAADFSDLASAPGIKVGVVWSGSKSRADNRARSFKPQDLWPIEGASLFSLQKGDAAAEASDMVDFGRMTDLGPRLGDFADTAAAIAALDLVISVDTAVAHLAGALGKPVWIVLPHPTSAFLWMTGRDDTPWYPSARLFRQAKAGDWAEVMTAIRKAFAERYA